jgi:hypothetical protein
MLQVSDCTSVSVPLTWFAAILHWFALPSNL